MKKEKERKREREKHPVTLRKNLILLALIIRCNTDVLSALIIHTTKDIYITLYYE